MKNKKFLKSTLAVACVCSMLITSFLPVQATNASNSDNHDYLTESSTVEMVTESNQLVDEILVNDNTFSISKESKNQNTVKSNATGTLSLSQMTMGLKESYTLIPRFGSKHTWKSSNNKVAIVNNEGQVTALAVGSATITCTASNGTVATCLVAIRENPTSMTLDTDSLVLGVGETHDYASTVNAGAGAFYRGYASSSSIGLPVVRAGGLATAKKAGKYTVACTAYNGVRAKCSVTVKDAPSALSLDKSAVNLEVGKSYTLSPIISANSHSSTYTASSSNNAVATVSVSNENKIIVKGVKEGTATISVKTYNGKTATCKIAVSNPTATLAISTTSTTILKGNHAYVKAVVSPETVPVTYSSSNTAVATVNSNGIVTGKGAGTVTITANANGVKKSCKITVLGESSDTYVPYSAYTLNNQKTLYLKSTGSTFSSSDTSVCTVNSKGFVTAKKQGVAIITADYKGSKRTCAITVIGSEPIRFSYSSPNSASKNEKVQLIAYTDTMRTALKFNVQVGNKTETVDAVKKLDSTKTRYIWTAYYTFTSAGEYPVTAYSMYNNNGKFSTCEAGKSTVFVTDVSSSKTVSFMERRASNEILKLNAEYEGYVGSSVYDDPLVWDTPTVGYGYVVTNGDVFYNNMTKDEAFAFMVRTMNDSYYTSAVNSFLTNNNIKFNQQQFDALVMLVYNLGSGVLYDDCVAGILKNCYQNGTRNLDYVDKKALIEELIQWHHAGGCVWGLLYRRIDELEVFCYGDYLRDGNSNKYNMTYRWNCY
ncbi:MAG: Ig-like domain-containing protein [Acutalibacteraceae bacterium]|nr:Ig-like domain-containing protein [Acutalibacteraceae bacterium]